MHYAGKQSFLASDDKLLFLEQQLRTEGFVFIAGVDEAGRGPLAGPVVAAAVIFPEGAKIPAVRDSKQLSEREREELAEAIRAVEGIRFAVVEWIESLQQKAKAAEGQKGTAVP